MHIAVDERWFDRYQALSVQIGETYELLLPDNETLQAKRREFELSDHTVPVALYPDRANTGVINKAREQLDRLKTEISHDEENLHVRESYIDAIAALDWNAMMILAGTNQDDMVFRQANSFLYDPPSRDVFKAVCHWIRHDAKATYETGDENLAKPAEDVLRVIPDLHDNHHMIIPSEKLFHEVRRMHRRKGGYYDTLFGDDGLPTDAYIDERAGDDICRRMLENIGSDFTMAPSDNNIWAVFPSRKQVVRPAGYRMDRDEFVGVVCHEIGSHVLEHESGQKQHLKLLGVGLAGYEKGNEGRAFLREQIVYENERTFLRQFAWEYIAALHLSVCLASGVYQKPYDFAALYHVLYILYRFWRERRLPRSTNNDAFAHDEAWQLAVRIMKGTNGTGGAYMKDSVYLEGNIHCWQAAATDAEIILRGDLGKIDITNPRHMEIIEKFARPVTPTSAHHPIMK